jgi:hypothetical protein
MPAQLLAPQTNQCLLAEAIGIAFAGLGKVDDFLGDHADEGVGPIGKTKGCQRRYEAPYVAGGSV